MRCALVIENLRGGHNVSVGAQASGMDALPGPHRPAKINFHRQGVGTAGKVSQRSNICAADPAIHRMASRGQIKEDEFRVIWKSAKFPTSSFAYAHDLEPKLRDQMLKCFYEYRFPAEMQKAFDGADRFFPVTFLKDWAIVRQVAEAGGEKFNRAAYEKETAREAAAKKK